MTNYWTPPPSFTAGQIASATALNVLSDDCGHLLSLYQIGDIPFEAFKWADGDFREGLGAYGSPTYWFRIYTGRWRHDGAAYDTQQLQYSFSVTKDPSYKTDIRVQIGTNWIDQSIDANLRVAAGTGTVTVTGTRALSYYSFTDDLFYDLNVEARVLDGSNNPVNSVYGKSNAVLPLYLRIYQANTLAALAGFTTGSTPTAAQWQALSTRAAYYFVRSCKPRAMQVQTVTPPPSSGISEQIWWGRVRHINNYLFYDFYIKQPYNERGRYYVTYVATLYYNNTAILSRGVGVNQYDISATDTTLTLYEADAGGVTFFAAGSNITSSTGEVITLGTKSGSQFTGCTRGVAGTLATTLKSGVNVWHWQAKDKSQPTPAKFIGYRGLVNIAALSLSEGTEYSIRVDQYYHVNSPDNPGDTEARLQVNCIREYQPVAPTVSWWTAPPQFAQGDSVTGTGSMKVISDDLTALATRLYEYRYPCHINKQNSDSGILVFARFNGLANVRLHRWLHYYCQVFKGSGKDERDLSPKLGYFASGAWSDISLPYEANKWLRYDLDDANGLYVGSMYYLSDVTFALEDYTY